MSKKFCACLCGQPVRNRGRYISGHNETNKHLNRGSDTKPHVRESGGNTTIIYKKEKHYVHTAGSTARH